MKPSLDTAEQRQQQQRWHQHKQIVDDTNAMTGGVEVTKTISLEALELALPRMDGEAVDATAATTLATSPMKGQRLSKMQRESPRRMLRSTKPTLSISTSSSIDDDGSGIDVNVLGSTQNQKQSPAIIFNTRSADGRPNDQSLAFASDIAKKALNSARMRRLQLQEEQIESRQLSFQYTSFSSSDYGKERVGATALASGSSMGEEKKLDRCETLDSSTAMPMTAANRITKNEVVSSKLLDAKTSAILAEAQRASSRGVNLRLVHSVTTPHSMPRSSISRASSMQSTTTATPPSAVAKPVSVLRPGTPTSITGTSARNGDNELNIRAAQILKEARAVVHERRTNASLADVEKASESSDGSTSTDHDSEQCNGDDASSDAPVEVTANFNNGNGVTVGDVIVQHPGDALDDFLTLAEQRSKEAAAEAVRDVPNEYQFRSTKDVLRMASGVLNAPSTAAAAVGLPLTPSPSKIMRMGSDGHPLTKSPVPAHDQAEKGTQNSLSPTSSDVGSFDDYEMAIGKIADKLDKGHKLSREKILKRIDGMPSPHPHDKPQHDELLATSTDGSMSVPVKKVVVQEVVARTAQREATNRYQQQQLQQQQQQHGAFSFLNYIWGSGQTPSKVNDLDIINPLSCGPVSDRPPAMATSIVRVKSEDTGFAEAVNKMQADPRMPDWFNNQLVIQNELPAGSVYHLGDSKTVIVHEIQRGNWTWCTAWSPDGKYLAMATENHHLSVVDATTSAVWRVHHDKRANGPGKKDTTHTVRSIAWGHQFIAIGGTGDAVSILAPTEPYPLLHTIKDTGFVDSLDWLMDSNTLLIGSRNGKATIVKVWARDDLSPGGPIKQRMKEIDAKELHTIDRGPAWVNVAKFSPAGRALAVADSEGILSIHSYAAKSDDSVKLNNVANFKLEDSILSLDWSANGKWLYSGGEDFAITIINTERWEAIHRIKRDCWVQFIASSASGTHVAVGGVSSEVSILGVEVGWDTILNVGLKGLVPLSAQWHPQDQYLVLTGQDNSVLAVETTNARYVTGHFLRSMNPILAVEFSPDGRMAAVGNEAGVITIFRLSGSTFISCYEAVLDCDGSLSIVWSKNGSFVSIVSGTKLVIITKTKSKDIPKSAPPNTSGFSVTKVVRSLGHVHSVAVHPQSRYMAVCGDKKTILDVNAGFESVKEWANDSGGKTLACAWSDDGSWLATVGQEQPFTVYDTTATKVSEWRPVFTVETEQSGLALAWGPPVKRGLQYCAFGGEEQDITIMEIRSTERTWEIILIVPREGIVHDLDWNSEGLLAAAVGNGTVTVMDTSYLQSGWAVNEMDYTWQRQALTCFTEIRRNRGVNSMRAVRWIPSAPGSDTLLAAGGTDGEIEILDLTERERCSGFNKVNSPI